LSKEECHEESDGRDVDTAGFDQGIKVKRKKNPL
jgi:hypothetical protein